jgi:hypothetical protein
MPPAGFEPTIPASERPQIHVLDRAATGIGHLPEYVAENYKSANDRVSTESFFRIAEVF